MGQSSSQVVPQFVEEPEVLDKQERRKKSKKRKEKKIADPGGEHAGQEEEIAQTLLEMKDTGNSDENDIAAAHQLLAESSPARHGTADLVNGGSVQSRKTAKVKTKSKKNRKSQKDVSTDLEVPADVHGYVDELLGSSSRAAHGRVNGSQREPQVFVSSSMPVPSLDDMDSNDENIAPYLKEYDKLSAIAEPTTPSSYVEGGRDHERIESPLLPSSMGEKRKRKRRKDHEESATAVTDGVKEVFDAEAEAPHKSPELHHQNNGSISTRRSDAGSESEPDIATESIDQRHVSPDLYNIPLDPVLPGIEDPTSPAYKDTGKRRKHQRKQASAGKGDQPPQKNFFVSINQEPEPGTVSHEGPSKPSKKVSSKRKRPVTVDDSVDQDSTKQKKKRRSVDYKTAQLRKVSQGPILNGTDEGPKEGPFTDAEIAKLFAFRDQHCEENDWTQEQFIRQIHANAHNNPKNIGFWNEVSEVLPYRTRHALQRVCRRRFHNFTKRGTWTKEEDKELRQAHDEHGNKWKVIGEQIERLPEDCRDRWRNYLKDSQFRNHDEWTDIEVGFLRTAVAECMDAMKKADREQKKREATRSRPSEQQDGEDKEIINWGAVSERLGGSRSRLQCSYKWKHLADKAKKPGVKPKKVVRSGAKKLKEWKKKKPEKKYSYMLPGDKYELLNALGGLDEITDDSDIVWRDIGDDSFRSVWTAEDCEHAYSQMKETISSFADVMEFDEVINTLKEKLEEEHPDELDMHWRPNAKEVEKPATTLKKAFKSKKTRPKKQTLSTEIVEESDLDTNTNENNRNPNDEQNSDSGEVSRDQTPTATPDPDDDADTTMDGIPDTQASPEVEGEAEAETESETDSNPASSDALVTDDDDDADGESEPEPEPEIADSDQEGQVRTARRTSAGESDGEDDDDDDDEVDEDEDEDEGVDEQLASKVMLLRNA